MTHVHGFITLLPVSVAMNVTVHDVGVTQAQIFSNEALVGQFWLIKARRKLFLLDSGRQRTASQSLHCCFPWLQVSLCDNDHLSIILIRMLIHNNNKFNL